MKVVRQFPAVKQKALSRNRNGFTGLNSLLHIQNTVADGKNLDRKEGGGSRVRDGKRPGDGINKEAAAISRLGALERREIILKCLGITETSAGTGVSPG
jgi:hypothetical protein